MPKLSIVTCVYNAERYLQESLDSVFNQPYEDFELVLVHDCSTDNSKDILLCYTDRPNVVLLENKYNEGVPFSRNRAFIIAKGEYIAIHDADDVSLPHRFQKQVAYLDEHPEVTFIGGHAIRISDTGMQLGNMVYPPEKTDGAFRVIRQFKLNPIIDPSSMFRRQPILDIGGYRMEPELRTVQDFDLWCRLLVNGHRLYNFQEPLIKYRINPKGITRIKKDEQMLATDFIWAAFRRRSFPKVQLRQECFSEDFELDFLNNRRTKDA
ncbi:MAG: glycosyltransferase [Promethearchaeota archaeon]|jgi:glycosyltransferase involved in cell wall biosynthesis